MVPKWEDGRMREWENDDGRYRRIRTANPPFNKQ